MKISELAARQGKVEVEGTLNEFGEPREFDKNGNTGKVVNAMLSDESGKIKLSLWNEDADLYKDGDKIKLSNGYVNEWQGELQLSAGKFGKIEKVE